MKRVWTIVSGVMPAWLTPQMLLIGVLAIGGGFAWWKIYQSGKNAGYHEGNQVQLKTDDQVVKNNDRELKAVLAAEEEKQAIAKERQAAAEERIASAKERGSRAEEDARRARAEIDRLPQSAVMPKIREQLALHPAADPNPALYPDEARAVAGVLAEIGGLQKQLKALQDAAAEHTEADKQRDVRISSLERERDQALDKYNALYPVYVKARNASMKRCGLFKRIVTVGYGCEKKLDLPDPATLVPADKEKP